MQRRVSDNCESCWRQRWPFNSTPWTKSATGPAPCSV